MKKKSLEKEFYALAKKLGMKPEDMSELCVNMLKSSDLSALFNDHAEQCKCILDEKKALIEKMRRGTRRTHGSVKFSI